MREEQKQEQAKKALLPKTHFFPPPNSTQKSSNWDSLMIAVEAEDYKSAKQTLYTISKTAKTLKKDIEADKSDEKLIGQFKHFLAEAEQILERTLKRCHKMLTEKSVADLSEIDRKKITINYWAARGIVSAVGQYIDFIRDEILSNIPWLPELLTTGERRALTAYEAENLLRFNLDATGFSYTVQMDTLFTPPSSLYVEPAWGETVYHPLYSMSRARAEIASNILLSRKPTLSGEEPWKPVTKHFPFLQGLYIHDDDQNIYKVMWFYGRLLEAKNMEADARIHIKAALENVFIPGIINIINEYFHVTIEALPERPKSSPAPSSETACCRIL